MHWRGAQFFVCRFLDSIDKSLNMLKFCQNNQRKRKNKKSVLVAESAISSQINGLTLNLKLYRNSTFCRQKVTRNLYELTSSMKLEHPSPSVVVSITTPPPFLFWRCWLKKRTSSTVCPLWYLEMNCHP